MDLEIDDVAYGGRGIARSSGKVIFVPGALPGERVRIRLARDRGNYAEADLEDVLHASPERVEPACPLAAAGCPGCAYQHASYAEELRLKQRQFESLLMRLGGLHPAACGPPAGAPSALAYRNKLVLHAGGGDRPALGYYRADNTTILDVPRCPLAVEAISAEMRRARAESGFLARLRSRTAVTFRHTACDGALRWVGRPPRNAVWLKEDTVLGRISVPRASFFQVNAAVADVLLARVLQLLEASPLPHAVDLYCGAGVFALCAARAGKQRIVGVDNDAEAIEAASYNLRERGGGVSLMPATAADALPEALRILDPSSTILVADPPRQGLERGVMETVIRGKPGEIIYVSCAPDAMARDMARLQTGGYQVQSAGMLDMFPRTACFECVAHLVRRSAGG